MAWAGLRDSSVETSDEEARALPWKSRELDSNAGVSLNSWVTSGNSLPLPGP